MIPFPLCNGGNVKLHPAVGRIRFALVADQAAVGAAAPKPEVCLHRRTVFLQGGHLEIVCQLHAVQVIRQKGRAFDDPVAVGLEEHVLLVLRR